MDQLVGPCNPRVYLAELLDRGRRDSRELEPHGFILTTVLGVVGAFVATYLGQAIGWYGPNDSAGFIGAIVGAVILLVIWGLIAGRQRSV